MTVQAIVAVRGGAATKSRCAGALTAIERNALVSAMLMDMIDVLTASRSVGQVHVVTPTEALADAARSRGARIVLEQAARGMNAAFETARDTMRRETPSAILVVLPGDLPLIRGSEIEAAIARLEPGTVVLVPAENDGGTAAIILHADAPFAFGFGPDSFRRHQENATRAGLTPVVVRLASLGLDIDQPGDLDELLRRMDDGRAVTVLRRRTRLPEDPTGPCPPP